MVVIFTLLIVLLFTVILEYLLNIVKSINVIIYYILYGMVLSSTIGYKSLIEYSKKVIDYIKEGNIEKGRKYVQNIVSRDSSKLDREHILSASIESATENITDSIIGPIFYSIFFGLVGAFIYRAINTLDAMIGYRNEKYEYYGKFGAILDDIINFIPSRLGGLLLSLTAPLYGGSIKRGLYGFFKEGDKTPSPNSGYTMAVIANGLNMTLEKIGCYKLGKGAITVEKCYMALLSVDIVVWSFFVIYTIVYLTLIFI